MCADKIRLMAFKPTKNEQKLFVMSFPEAWKNIVITLSRSNKNPEKTVHSILRAINSLASVWINDLAFVKHFSLDSQFNGDWLAKFSPFGDEDKDILCRGFKEILKGKFGKLGWAQNDIENLSSHQFSGDSEKTVKIDANILRACMVKKISGINFCAVFREYGNDLKFLRFGNSKLVSLPRKYEDHGYINGMSKNYFDHYFSIGVDFEVAPVYPGSENVVTLRFRRKNYGYGIRFLQKKANALVFRNNCIHRLAINKSNSKTKFSYYRPDEYILRNIVKCNLPNCQELMINILKFAEMNPRIFVPSSPSSYGIYAENMNGIGSFEASAWYDEISKIISDFAEPINVAPEATGFKFSKGGPKTLCSLPNKKIFLIHSGTEERKQAAELVIASSPTNISFLLQENKDIENIDVLSSHEGATKLAYFFKEKRNHDYLALVLLPGAKAYNSKKEDPKNPIRHVLSRAGILSQFVVPFKKESKELVSSSVEDLLRQEGLLSINYDAEKLLSVFPDKQKEYIYALRMIRVQKGEPIAPFVSRIKIKDLSVDIMSPIFEQNGWISYKEANLNLGCGKFSFRNISAEKILQSIGNIFQAINNGIFLVEFQNIPENSRQNLLKKLLLLPSSVDIVSITNAFDYLPPRKEGDMVEKRGIFKEESTDGRPKTYWVVFPMPSTLQNFKQGFRGNEKRKHKFLCTLLRKRSVIGFAPIRIDEKQFGNFVRYITLLNGRSIQYGGRDEYLRLPLPMHILEKLRDYMVIEAESVDDDPDEEI